MSKGTKRFLDRINTKDVAIYRGQALKILNNISAKYGKDGRRLNA